jgi:hypothetical protein
MPLRATVSETVVATCFTTRVCGWNGEIRTRGLTAPNGALSSTELHPNMAVPMGDDPTTSRSTTERSAVELRNHWRVGPDLHRRVGSLQLPALLLGDLPI